MEGNIILYSDNSHVYEEDTTYIFLNCKKEEEILYGIVLFRNKKDSSVKRGAIQKSLVIFSFKPYFSTWKPLMKSIFYLKSVTLEK
jgi:hypothetical protein